MNTQLIQSQRNLFYIAGGLSLVILVLGFITNQLWFIGIPLAMVSVVFLLLDLRLAFFLLCVSVPMSINLLEYLQIGIDFPDEPLMLFLTAVFIPFVLFNYHAVSLKEKLNHPMVLLVLAMFFWMIVSVVFSENPQLSIKYLVKRIWFLIPFLGLPLFLFHDNRTIRRAFICMAIPLVVITMIVIFRHSRLGFRFEEVHDPIQPFFVNHVMYGSMISCFIPLLFGALYLSRRFSMAWLFALLGILVLLTGVYFAYSRAAWMAVLFAGGAMILIYFRVMHYAMMLFYTILISAVLWLSFNSTYLNFRPRFEKTIMHESIADHIMATIQGTDISSAERYYRWIAAVRMSMDRPLTGVGPNNFYDHYKSYTITAYRTWVSRNMERSTTHNYFLFMLVEQGYPAMILYAALILAIFYYGQCLYHRLKDRFEKVTIMAVLSMIAALFINNFFSELLETDKIGSLFLMGISILVALDLKERKGRRDSENLSLV